MNEMTRFRPSVTAAQWGIVLVVLSVGLAGCVGSQTAGEASSGGQGADATAMEDGEAGSSGGQTDGTGAAAALAFPAAADVTRTLWFNGTFEITEHSWPKGMVTSALGMEYDPDRRTHDVTDEVPEGVPAVVRAEINADVGEGDVDLWFEFSDDIWTASADAPYGGYTAAEIGIVRVDDPVVVTLRYDEIDDSAAFDYTLRVDVIAHPDLVPAGIPVAVDVPTGADGLRIEFAGEGEGRAAWVWDPDDALVGRFDPGDERISVPLGPDAPRGEYVVMAAQGSGPVRVHLLAVDGEDATPLAPPPGQGLRALTQVIEMSDPQSANAGEASYTWTFEADRTPLQAAILWWGPAVSRETDASLSGPEGTLFDLTISTDEVWIFPGFGWLTAMGAEGLAAGTYEASVAFGDAAIGPDPVTVQHALVYYGR